MAALRNNLQRDLFSPAEERLVGLIHVTNSGKKKKGGPPCFLCVAVTTDQTVGAMIYKVKKTEKSNIYKKKSAWHLKDLKLVDGIDGNKETANFDIQLDKLYHWVASNVQERLMFFAILWKLCSKYLPKQSPMFVNIPSGITEDSVQLSQATPALEDTQHLEGGIGDEDYQALTDREEKDLENLLSQSDGALSNAEKFMEILAKDLSLLDGANIYSLMGSETQVIQLLNLLEAAENEAAKIENELDRYENVLLQARVAMATVGEKNVSLETANRNNRLLLMELNNLVAQLDVPHNHQVTLNNPDLNSPTGLQNAIAAAKALQRAMNAELKPGLEKMSAVQDQRKQLEKWRAKFSPTVTRQLNNLFIHLSNADTGETSSQSSRSSNSSQTTVSLAKHGKLHSQLQMYAPLMHWLKATDRGCYEKLLEVYTNSICKLYERDLRQFFDDARAKVMGLKEKKLRGSDSGSEISTRHMSIKSQPGNMATGASPSGNVIVQSQNLLGNEKELWTVEVDIQERKRLEDLLECALAELEPVCLIEQEFCVGFFALDQGIQEEDMIATTPSSKLPDRSINEEVRKMMSVLFAVLEPELVSFLATYEKVDSFSPLYVLVRLSQHVLSATDTGSFLSVTFGSSLVQVKRAFDRFFMTQLRSIEDSKQPRKSKCGILPLISNFEEFSLIIENIFRNSERRVDVDKWYTRLVRAMFDVTPRIAVENSKTPADIIKMENYHRLHALLSQLKIAVLDAEKKEAKQKYQEALQSYVIQYFGRPLEKLNQFFDGVQAKVGQGVKESEIGYQMAFSKQELRKVISIYPGREVKKGLESLYKKVEKHLSDESNLLQVVWRAMQEEFIRQYKSLEDMIQRCYPGALITLEFSMSDILEYFSDIARSH